MGFFNKKYGVISYDKLPYDKEDSAVNRNFCYGKGDTVPVVGTPIQLTHQSSVSYRDYAVVVHFCGKYIQSYSYIYHKH